MRRRRRLRFMRARHRTRCRHLDYRLSRLKKRRSNRRVLSPIDRAVESEEILQFALDIDDVLAAGDADGAAEDFLDDRQRGSEGDGRRSVRFIERDLFPWNPMRFAVTGKAGGTFLGRDRSEAVDTDEMTEIRVHRIHAVAIVVERQPDHGAAVESNGERQLVVRDRQRLPAIDCRPILCGEIPDFAGSPYALARRSFWRKRLLARRSFWRRRRNSACQKGDSDARWRRGSESHRHTRIRRSR